MHVAPLRTSASTCTHTAALALPPRVIPRAPKRTLTAATTPYQASPGSRPDGAGSGAAAQPSQPQQPQHHQQPQSQPQQQQQHAAHDKHHAQKPHAPSTAGSAATVHETSPATAISGFLSLNRVHVVLLSALFILGALACSFTLQFTADMEFSTAISTVLRRVVTKSQAFRQLVVIGVSILLVRYCLNGALQALSSLINSRLEWDQTKLFYILREVYQPLELLLLIAAVCTVADTFVPSLISVPKATVTRVVAIVMSTSYILGFSSVIFSLKSRFCKENAWQAEMKGDVTVQRRWEAYDKLGSFVVYVVSFVLTIQTIGLEITSVLAIGGIGGLAIGLAGREICENLLNGLLLMSTNPFEVGDEIQFFHTSKVVEGMVIDIGWYRTQIRSFEREVFVIPNSVFSKNIVLNVTRKNREFRFNEALAIRVQDVQKANSIIQDIRRIVKNDARILTKLHRRIFLDKITLNECRIYMSFYIESANRDAFMSIKQDMLLAFVDVVQRNGAQLATPRTLVDMERDVAELIGGFNPMLAGIGIAAAQSMQQQAQQAQQQAQQQSSKGKLNLPESGDTIAAEATTVVRPLPTAPAPSSSAGMAGAAAAAGEVRHAQGGGAGNLPGEGAAGGGSSNGNAAAVAASSSSGGSGAGSAVAGSSGSGSASAAAAAAGAMPMAGTMAGSSSGTTVVGAAASSGSGSGLAASGGSAAAAVAGGTAASGAAAGVGVAAAVVSGVGISGGTAGVSISMAANGNGGAVVIGGGAGSVGAAGGGAPATSPSLAASGAGSAAAEGAAAGTGAASGKGPALGSPPKAVVAEASVDAAAAAGPLLHHVVPAAGHLPAGQQQQAITITPPSSTPVVPMSTVPVPVVPMSAAPTPVVPMSTAPVPLVPQGPVE